MKESFLLLDFMCFWFLHFFLFDYLLWEFLRFKNKKNWLRNLVSRCFCWVIRRSFLFFYCFYNTWAICNLYYSIIYVKLIAILLYFILLNQWTIVVFFLCGSFLIIIEWIRYIFKVSCKWPECVFESQHWID